MASVPAVPAQPVLVFQGEGHTRVADATSSAAVVAGHEAGNLVNFEALALARGGYATNEQVRLQLGFVGGRLTVVGGSSTATIVTPNPYGEPQAHVETQHVDLLSVDGRSPTPAPPPETSQPVNATLPAPPPEASSDYVQTTVSANLDLVGAEENLINLHQRFVLASDNGQTDSAYRFGTSIFKARAAFLDEPFAGVGRTQPAPFDQPEIPRVFVDGSY